MPPKKIALASFAVLSVAALAYLIFANTPGKKQLGSFEYIRKGEALIDKGKIRESLAFFEKAYEESPPNENIRMSLVWAYSRYAVLLAQNEDYGSAIDYLTKAYEVKANNDTATNLALAYSRMGLRKAEGGDISDALEYYSAAREAASEHTKAGRNLAISLFNDAVTEYKEGREETAILCLKESSLAYEDYRAYELLGDIYYKRRELEKARFNWSRAAELNPGEKSVTGRLARLEKEMGLAESESRIEMPHFEVHYEKSIPVSAEKLGRVLERAYFDVGRDFSYLLASRTIVYFYSEEDFQRIFALPGHVRAFYDGNIKMPFPAGAVNENELTRYIYHEYTHAVVSAMTNNNCPAWFNEGLATWVEFKGNDEALASLLSKVSSGIELSLESLNEGISPKSKDPRLYYLLSYTVVKYIVDKWGLAGLRDLLKRMAGGQHIVNAIDDEFLLSEKEFTARWRDYVRMRYFK